MRRLLLNRIVNHILLNYFNILKENPTNLYRFQSIGRLINLIGSNCNGLISRPNMLTPLLAFSLTVYAKFDEKDEEKKLFERADKLFNENKFDSMVELLKSNPSWEDNNEVTWRLARCYYHQLKYRSDKGSPEYMEVLKGSLALIEKSLEINSNCGPAHKWASIILDEYSTVQGTKVRIGNLLKIKGHMEKAIEYSPKDPTVYYLLGEWHYGCSSVTWVERNLAKIIYGSLPEASYETALELFEQAEKIEPGFYSKNQIMIAKTLLALNREKDKATDHLKAIVTKYKGSKKWADAEAYKEATTLLSKIGEQVPS